MPRTIHFKRARNRRSKKHGTSSGLIIGLVLFLVAGIILTLGGHLAASIKDVPVSARHFAAEASWKQEVFKNILIQNIPGMTDMETGGLNLDETNKEEISLQPGQEGNESMLHSTLYTLTRVNPTDPKTFLNSQLTSMKMVSSLAESYCPEEDSIFIEEIQREKEILEIDPDNYLANVNLGQGLSPLVLIYHSHTTESFVPTSGKEFTTDLSLTVVRVAEEIAKHLEEEYGIKVVHSREIHDIPRSESYGKSINTIKEMVKRYPEAAMVIDLHRDGVSREVTTTQINGQDVGKTLLVLGSGHKNWKENYGFALSFHEKSEELYPGLSRGIRDRRFTYNQEVHPRAILLEIGGHRNSLEEALRTGRYVAEIIGELFKEMQ